MKNQKNAKVAEETKAVEVKVKETKTVKTEETKRCHIFIASGNSGAITNGTMIDALKLHLDDKDAIKEIYEFYPNIVKSAAKYLSDREKLILNGYIEGLNLEVKAKVVKATKKVSEEYTMVKDITANLYNPEKIEQLKNNYPDLFAKAILLFNEKTN